MKSGIVLKKYFPHKQKIALLDRNEGRVEYTVLHEKICLGALIYYTVTKLPRSNVIETYEIVDAPLQRTHQDLFFIHQLLELCYYFVPQGYSDEDIFDLMVFFYSYKGVVTQPLRQRILIKFFVTLGIYPENQMKSLPLFAHIGSVPIDILIDKDLNLGCDNDIKIWLRSCIFQHPKAHEFKTMHF